MNVPAEWEQLGLSLSGDDAALTDKTGRARTAAAVPAAVWRILLADWDTANRYRGKVYRRGFAECWYWLGAISSTGHGKLRAGSKHRGLSRVVTAHVYGWQLAHGALNARPDEDPVISHICDEASCQNAGHWRLGSRADNTAEYLARRRRAGGPLADPRGPRGRAEAIRDAIVTARRSGADVEAAIAAAIAAGIVDVPRLF